MRGGALRCGACGGVGLSARGPWPAALRTAASEPGWVPDHVAGRVALLTRPAGAALGETGGVEAAARDDHVHVAGVGVDRDPAAAAGRAPAAEGARGERRGEQAGAVQ